MEEFETKKDFLDRYIPIANFISEVNGDNCEVVLRDYDGEKSTILYIKNGELSNRKVGDTVSGYALSKIMKEDYEKTDFVSNYILINESNQKVFRASTYYIKTGNVLEGMLCVNYDLSDIIRYRDFFDKKFLYGLDENVNLKRDYFDESMDKILDTMIRNVFVYRDVSIPINKVDIENNPIRQLYNLGVFNYKGAVLKVANLIDVSTQTIYRHIKEIERLKE